MATRKTTSRRRSSSVKSEHFSVKYVLADKPVLTVVLPRKIGTAVERNKLKRRIKESIRLIFADKRKDGEIVIFPDITIKKCDFWAIKAELGKALAHLGLLSPQ